MKITFSLVGVCKKYVFFHHFSLFFPRLLIFLIAYRLGLGSNNTNPSHPCALYVHDVASVPAPFVRVAGG